jgi:hypothetical protein
MVNLDARIMITVKWNGESQILIVTLFTITVKLQPVIIFLDEIRNPMKTKIHLNYIQEISLYHRVKNFITTTKTNQLMQHRKIISHCSLSESEKNK